MFTSQKEASGLPISRDAAKSVTLGFKKADGGTYNCSLEYKITGFPIIGRDLQHSSDPLAQTLGALTAKPAPGSDAVATMTDSLLTEGLLSKLAPHELALLTKIGEDYNRFVRVLDTRISPEAGLLDDKAPQIGPVLGHKVTLGHAAPLFPPLVLLRATFAHTPSPRRISTNVPRNSPNTGACIEADLTFLY